MVSQNCLHFWRRRGETQLIIWRVGRWLSFPFHGDFWSQHHPVNLSKKDKKPFWLNQSTRTSRNPCKLSSFYQLETQRPIITSNFHLWIIEFYPKQHAINIQPTLTPNLRKKLPIPFFQNKTRKKTNLPVAPGWLIRLCFDFSIETQWIRLIHPM